MRTFQQMHDDCNRAGQPCDYWGDRGDWLCVLGQSRDSDTIERSNFQVACQELEKIDPECYAIENESHWAVGWVETLLVDPSNQEAIALAEKIKTDLEDYPILDECHHSEIEWNEAIESWDNWARSDYHRALVKEFGDWPLIAEWLDNLSVEIVDSLAEQARQSVNEEYYFDSSGCNYNVTGLVASTPREMILDRLREERAKRVIPAPIIPMPKAAWHDARHLTSPQE